MARSLVILAVLIASEGLAAAAPTSTLATEADLKDAMSEIEAKGSRTLSLELNPFMGIVGAGASGNIEYMPMRHLGLIASPRASLIMPAWAGEIGARYWTGRRREASGFFVGPSAIY